MFRATFRLKHVELILVINKSLLLHLVGLSILLTYIDDARSDTNQNHSAFIFWAQTTLHNVRNYSSVMV